MAQRILLISDTHGFIDKKILSYCQEADEVWHAGDIGGMHVAEEIEKTTKLRAVYGNIDDQAVRQSFPLDQKFRIEEVGIWMTHIGGYPNRYESRIRNSFLKRAPQLFISGHSHILKVQYDKKFNLLHMNPGAIGKYGFHKVRTMLRFEIDQKDIKKLEVIELKR